MKRSRVEDFKKGWFIGDFTPSLLQTREFEAALKVYQQGDSESAHTHLIAHEYTIVASGRFRMNKAILVPGDIVELAPGEVADFECLEAGATFVIKTPSAPSDKHVVGQ